MDVEVEGERGGTIGSQRDVLFYCSHSGIIFFKSVFHLFPVGLQPNVNKRRN